MYLSLRRGFLFIHIPKTAGTALTLALEERALRDDIIVGDTPKARARARRQRHLSCTGRLWKHSTLADLDGLLPVSELEQLVTFTLVRNPWDRVASLYFWLKEQSFANPMVGIAKTEDFSGFIRSPTVALSLRTNGFESYLRRPDGSIKPSHFVRIEQFGEDIAPIARHLGYPLPDLEHVNQSKRPRDWRGLYSDMDARWVGELCSADIQRFGYCFDPPSLER